jgi:hypothetical protein
MRTCSDWRRRSPKRAYRLGLLVLALTGTVAGGVAVADGSGDDGPSGPLPQTVEVTGGASAQQLDAFSLMNRSITAADAVSDVTAAQVGDTLAVKAHGMNVALARRASTAVGAVWVTPGDGETCILVGDAASASGTTPPDAGVVGCLSDADAAAGKLVASLARIDRGSADGIVAGLVPDGVASVEFHFADGSTRVSDVHDNVYATKLDGPEVDSVSFSGSAGEVSVQVSL